MYQTQYHVVWIPKYRRKVLVPGVKEYLEKAFSIILAERYPDVYISEQNIQPDHVHMLLEIPPKYAVSTVIGVLKGGSSRGGSTLNRGHEHQRLIRRCNAREGRPRCFGGTQQGSGT